MMSDYGIYSSSVKNQFPTFPGPWELESLNKPLGHIINTWHSHGAFQSRISKCFTNKYYITTSLLLLLIYYLLIYFFHFTGEENLRHEKKKVIRCRSYNEQNPGVKLGSSFGTCGLKGPFPLMKAKCYFLCKSYFCFSLL